MHSGGSSASGRSVTRGEQRLRPRPPAWFVGEVSGWGAVPFQANGHGWLTVYIIAPLLGGVLGGAIYRTLFRPAYAG